MEKLCNWISVKSKIYMLNIKGLRLMVGNMSKWGYKERHDWFWTLLTNDDSRLAERCLCSQNTAVKNPSSTEENSAA